MHRPAGADRHGWVRGRVLSASDLVADPARTGRVYVLTRDGHAIGVLQSHALLLIVQGARGVLVQREYLLVGNAQLAAHGSVYVLSEFAAVYGSDPPVDEGDELGVDEARGV